MLTYSYSAVVQCFLPPPLSLLSDCSSMTLARNTRELRLRSITIYATTTLITTTHDAPHGTSDKRRAPCYITAEENNAKITKSCDQCRCTRSERNPNGEREFGGRATNFMRHPSSRRRYTCCTACTFVHFARFKRQIVRRSLSRTTAWTAPSVSKWCTKCG